MSRSPGRPLASLYIYMCEECNLACKHCYQSAPARSDHVSHASAHYYTEVVRQAMPLGLGNVFLSGGEPLLRKRDVIQLLNFLHAVRVKSSIGTNGTLLDDEIADAIERARTTVTISLDGGTDAVHEQLRAIPGCFEKTMAGLDRLRKRNVPVVLNMSLHRGNVNDLPRLIAMASNFREASININVIIESGRAKRMKERKELLSVDEIHVFARRVEQEYTNHRPKVSITTPPAFHSLTFIQSRGVRGGSCGIKDRLGVLPDGRISLCWMGYEAFGESLGPSLEASLERLWNGHPALEHVRASIPAQLKGVCGNCVMKSSCEGSCRAEAFKRYGSILAPHPACQELYEAGLFPTQRLISPYRDCHYRADSMYPLA